MTTLHDFTATTLAGAPQPLSTYADRVVLVVNTASKCGLTPQFTALEKLWQEFGPDKFAILGFPCNQFARQEPHNAPKIAEFCQLNYGVSFPMFAKVDVNGPNTDPLWAWLKSERKGLLGGRISWNFTKFLINPDGHVMTRYAPTRTPEKIRPDIHAILG